MSTGKFKALVHYMVHKSQDSPGRLGDLRLDKALWFADKLAYQIDGESITGEVYVKRKKGPVPKSIQGTLQELQDEGKVLVQDSEHRFMPRNFLSLVAPENDVLSEIDRLLADHVLRFVWQHEAEDISELTHDEIWDAAIEGEEIPLYATLVSGIGAITDEIREWADSVVQEREAA